MAKKKAGIAGNDGTATIERGMLPGESGYDDIRDEPTDSMPVPVEQPIASLADLLNRMAQVDDADLAALADLGRSNYQYRGGKASVQVKFDEDGSDTLRRLLFVLNRSNTRLGDGALARHVQSQADAVKMLMKLVEAETVGRNAA